MSVVMLRRATRDLQFTVLWYGLGLFLYGVFILLLYPTVRDNTEMLDQYLQAFPLRCRRPSGSATWARLRASSVLSTSTSCGR